MTTIEVVLDGGEVLELEVGEDNLHYYAADHHLAATQLKLWGRRKAIAGKVLETFQDSPKAVYPGSRGDVVITKRGASWHATVSADELADVELSTDDMVTLIRHSTGFTFPKIDSGLKGNKPEAWKPTTALGHLLKDMAKREPFRAGYVLSEPATQLAEES